MFHNDKVSLWALWRCPSLSMCQIWISTLSVKQRQEAVFAPEYLTPTNVSWLAALGVCNILTWEPMFHILSRFKFVWLGFESLKVGHLLFSCICTLHIFLGSPVWRAINLTQLIQMLKFLLRCIVNVRDLLCFKFHLMTNPFDLTYHGSGHMTSRIGLLINLQILTWVKG